MSDENLEGFDFIENWPELEPVCPKCDAGMRTSGAYVYDVVHTDRHEVSEVTEWVCPNCGYKTETSEDLRSYRF